MTSVFPAGKRCLQFYYHMRGRSIGKLTVYVKVVGGSMYPEWVKEGEVGNDWNLGLLSIDEKKPFQVCLQFTAFC